MINQMITDSFIGMSIYITVVLFLFYIMYGAADSVWSWVKIYLYAIIWLAALFGFFRFTFIPARDKYVEIISSLDSISMLVPRPDTPYHEFNFIIFGSVYWAAALMLASTTVVVVHDASTYAWRLRSRLSTRLAKDNT